MYDSIKLRLLFEKTRVLPELQFLIARVQLLYSVSFTLTSAVGREIFEKP